MNAVYREGTRAAFATMLVLAGTTAVAETQFMPPIPVTDVAMRDYQCLAGQKLHVTYYQYMRDGQSFARLRVRGKDLLFVNTLAASGVKYVAGPYVWWTKGNQGDLYDITEGPNAAPIIAGCTSTPPP
jgi:membrane-bound inhibitor of C-type lysozyme